jgi:hypothetical protein
MSTQVFSRHQTELLPSTTCACNQHKPEAKGRESSQPRLRVCSYGSQAAPVRWRTSIWADAGRHDWLGVWDRQGRLMMAQGLLGDAISVRAR